MSHFGPPDSIRRRVGRVLSRGGAPLIFRPARRAGRAFTRLSRLFHRGREGRPLLHEALPHDRTRRNPENRDLEASSWGPPHDEPFRATQQHSTMRGEAPLQRGGLAQIFRAGHTGRKAIYQLGWPLPQWQGGEAAFARNASARL